MQVINKLITNFISDTKLNRNVHLLLNSLLLMGIAINLWLFISTPLSGDTLICIAASRQADFLGKFPINVYNSWNLRGIGHKYIFYIIYRITSMFTGIENHLIFQNTFKVIYYIIFFLLLTLSIKLLNFDINKKNNFFLILFFIMAFIVNSTYVAVRAEEIAVIFALLQLGFTFHKHHLLNYFSGIFTPILLSLKGITVYYSFLIFILLFFLNVKKNKVKIFIISNLIFLILTFFFYYFVIPQEINDLLLATKLQSSFMIDLNSFKRLPYYYLISIFHLPLNIFGAILFLKYSIEMYSQNNLNLKKLFSFLLIPILTAIYVLVQNQFFIYHYYIFYLFYFILLIKYSIKHKVSIEKFKLFIIIISLISIFIKTNPLIKRGFVNNRYIKWSNSEFYKNDFYNTRIQAYAEINGLIKESSDQNVLFLTDGVASYLIPSKKSFLKFFYPLPLQRVTNNNDLFNNDLYIELTDKILNYEGEYIILEPKWFHLNQHRQIFDFINQNFYTVYKYHSDSFTSASVILLKRHSNSQL